ncbi:hypothetical protein OC835_006923 [Tilletia horrida]|nr:hypothetical protein OC835_006923 [Tilletia horrida]
MRGLLPLLGALCALAPSVSALLGLVSTETEAPPLAGPGAPSGNATIADIKQACSLLAHKLGSSKVVKQGLRQLQYAERLEHSWNKQQSYYKPGCIAFPASTDEVVLTYKAIIDANVPYGVRSGSHGVTYGWCSTPGVLLDLVNMDQVEYDAERGVALVGPGNRWGRVYDGLAKHNQTVIGGRVTDVGMGLLLNGGVSYLSGEHGFASTNIVEIEIVLPTGQLVVATPGNQYKDLLWALQTGANSFGIVTKFTLKTIPTDHAFWGGLVFYAAEQFSAVSDAAVDFFDEVTDPKAAIIPTFEFIGSPVEGLLKPFAIFALSYAGPQPPPGIFDRLLAIPHTKSTVQTRPYAGPGGVVHSFDGLGAVYGNDQSFRVQGHKLTKDVARSALAASFNLTKTLGTDLATYSLSYEHILGQTIAISNRAGGTPYGYDEQPLTYVLYNLANKGSLPTARKQSILKTFNSIVDRVPSTGTFPLYLAYAGPDQQPLQTFRNYDRLKAIKQKYDPKGFVQSHAGGPQYH